MKIHIYARVSTDKQTHDSQLAELRDYCQRRGWADVTEHFDTISGAKFTRSGLDALMTLVRSGKADVVLVYKLDRLGRSLPHLAQLLEEFLANKVALISPGQGIDTTNSNPAAQFQIHILMAVAQFERSNIRERVIAGVKAAQDRGVKFGPKPKFAKLQPRVKELAGGGMSIRKIGLELGVSKSTVERLME